MRIKIILLSLLLSSLVNANTLPKDPLESVMWEFTRDKFIGDAPYVFDPQIKVLMPSFAEDPLQVPVTVDATALGERVKKVVVWSDLNPIQHILSFEPLAGAQSKFSFRFKVQQATPVRAAVLTDDGVWHMGGDWLEAAGGGCTAPSMGSGLAEWEFSLGETQQRLFGYNDVMRYKMHIVHPMDTGLANGIPEFFIEQVELRRQGDQQVIAKMAMSQPVSENPVLTFDFAKTDEPLEVWLRDNNGNEFLSQGAKL
ncbi:MAG: quinoprotein dehydrogenase-associated SoxYZ-like carrier [Pontibacterium sp.]